MALPNNLRWNEFNATKDRHQSCDDLRGLPKVGSSRGVLLRRPVVPSSQHQSTLLGPAPAASPFTLSSVGLAASAVLPTLKLWKSLLPSTNLPLALLSARRLLLPMCLYFFVN
mmetsp:Transcript_25187/g.36864  ORF Transcript_25187/g.36864 Transcript_25187/m.36864 type:complete len:113 (-) Transcript_25187:731-1069(-)